MERLKAIWRAERPNFPLWTPVFLGLGVQLYFWAPTEPSVWVFVLAIAAPLLTYALFWRFLAGYWLLGFAVVVCTIGFALAGARAHFVAAPVMKSSIDATVEGRIHGISRSEGGRARLLLDDVAIFGLTEAETPARVRITLLGREDLSTLPPGARVSIFAQIGPPSGPAEPGGFDFRRMAWFQSLGGVGFARGPAVVIPSAGRPGFFTRLSIMITGWRAEIAAGLRAALPGERGAFAAAVTVGDRTGVSRESTEALRDSNLAHLLAISGLHMGMVTALVFGAVRLVLAAPPFATLGWRNKAISAAVALVVATGYLALSGASVATQRAYVMAAVVLVAVMLNRPAVTLRALAVAAIIILALRPESLTHVGFQMSFAATAAVIAGFEWARRRGWSNWAADGGFAKKTALYVVALAGTSLLAGLATAPFAAFHFNRLSSYGLIANLGAVPVMGFWVAPSALVAAALAPIGLEEPALKVMGAGIEMIMSIARFVAALDGVARPVAATSPTVFAFVVIGGLALCLGRVWLKAVGGALCAVGLIGWMFLDFRPPVLAAPEGRLLGVMARDGRVLDHSRAERYVASQWLRRDGDENPQEDAADRVGLGDGYAGGRASLSNGWVVANVVARRPNITRLAELCRDRTVLLAPYARTDIEGPCLFLYGDALSRAGAMAFYPEGEAIRIITTADRAGRRLWTDAAVR